MNKQWSYKEREVIKTALKKNKDLAWCESQLETRSERAIRREAGRLAKALGIEGYGWWNRKPGAPERVNLASIGLKSEATKEINAGVGGWNAREMQILRAYYPRWGAGTVLRELLSEGYFRGIDEIEEAWLSTPISTNVNKRR